MVLAQVTNVRWERTGDRDMVLTWNPVAGATKYQVDYQRGGRDYSGWVARTNRFVIRDWAFNTGQRLKVMAWNDSGDHSGEFSAWTPWFYTPGPHPYGLSVELTPEGVLLKWKWDTSWYRAGIIVWRSSDDTYVTLGTGEHGCPSEFLDTTAGGTDFYYQVQSFVGPDVSGQRVFSLWSNRSPLVSRMVPPNSPKVVGPSGLCAVGGDVVFEWEHSPRDASVQMGAQVRYRREDAGSWTTVTVTGDATKHTVSGLLVGGYEYQVRTMGMSLEYGDWSPVQAFLMATRPVVTINAPTAGTYQSSILTVSWATTQAEDIPQSAAMVTLLQSGGVLAQKSVNGGATSVEFAHRLDNDSDYQVQVWAETSGLRSTVVTRSFNTVFIKPAIPVLTVTWDDDAGCHNIETNSGPMSGAVKPTVKLTLEKSLDGHEWELLDGDLPLSLSASVDWFGRSAGDTYYRLTAFTDEDATAETVVVSDPKSGAFWLAAGPDFTAPIRLAFGEGDPPKYSIDGARERHVEYYAGRELGVPSVGDRIEREVSFSGIIFEDLPGNCTREEFEQVVLTKTPRHLLRAPTGDVVYLALDSTPVVRSQHMVWNFSVSGDQVEAP